VSYEVIARRWRPQDFGGLVGQDHIRTTLINALKNDRLHHALLFTGPRGTGKTSTARILAKALRCPNAKDYIPCNQCPECEEISSGRSLNVAEIDGASNNGVDAIRELRETVGFLPSSGHHKLYIIDEVHMLSTSAFNALLKTLEEPPAHVFFVMATTEAHKIPNTILSRCQRFDFRRISTRMIAQHLQTICERDQIKFEPDALWTIARQGDGSMRDAQSLLDQVINFTDGDLRRELVVSTLGLTDRSLLLDLLNGIVASNTAFVMETLTRLHQSGNDPKLLLLDLMEQLRNSLLLKIKSDSTLVDIPDSEKEALLKSAAALSQEDLHLFFDMAFKGAQDLGRASDPLLVLEMVLLRMSSAPRVGSFGGGRVMSPPQPQPQAPSVTTVGVTSGAGNSTPTPVGATPVMPQTPLEERYRELVVRIKGINSLVGAQLENCSAIKIEGKDLTLSVSAKHKFLFDKINQPDFKKRVANYINSFWGPGHNLNILLGEQTLDAMTPKALGEKMEEENRQNLRKAVEAHPLVQSAQTLFKSEIKSIKEMKQ
jgi:DNA polymerase-3 subunit gamma/tau